LKRNDTTDVDVAVLGGGPAGAAATIELRRLGYSVAIIERTSYAGVRAGETLPPGIRPLLARLGVWERFLAQDLCPTFGIRSAWGHDEPHRNDFIFNPHGAGWNIARPRFDAMLACAASEAGAFVYRESRLLSCGDQRGDWEIAIAHNGWERHLRARFLVDASGRTSDVARRLGARRLAHDHLTGILFFLYPRSHESAMDTSTLVEAVENGWWSSLVLPDSRLVLAWMTDAEFVAESRTEAKEWRLPRLPEHTQSRVDGFAMGECPVVAPANSSRLDTVTNGRNWLATGDAAMAFDPLAGQGVHQGLQSGLRAATSIHDYWSGKPSSLAEYSALVNTAFTRYLRNRQAVYAREKRWPEHPFWKRRIVSY
jgi:flavin-dependent dehydrogenase